MDNDFVIDVEEVKRVIDTVEVLMVRFDIFDKRLLIDMRCLPTVGPLVKVVSRAGSLEERLRGIRELRPQFPLPEQIKVLHWPRYLSSFQRLGLWQQIVDRCYRLGYGNSDEQCQAAYQALARAEQEGLQAAITGEQFETLWQRRVS